MNRISTLLFRRGRSRLAFSRLAFSPLGFFRPGLSRLGRRLGHEGGSATAEYVVATMAAVGFAGLLVVILKGDQVRQLLTDLVQRALTVGS